MTQHSCQIDDRGSSLLSYCPTRKSGSQRSHHCEPGSFRTFFISESFQGLSPKVSPKLNTLSPPKSPPRFWASPPTFLESRQCREVQSRLNYLAQTKGFGLITGQPGTGKTTAIRKWIDSLNSAAYKTVYISLSTLTVMEFYRLLAEELGYEPSYRKADNFNAKLNKIWFTEQLSLNPTELIISKLNGVKYNVTREKSMYTLRLYKAIPTR